MTSIEEDCCPENDFLDSSQYSIENYRLNKSREQQLRNEMSRQSLRQSRQRSRQANWNQPPLKAEQTMPVGVVQKEPTKTQIFDSLETNAGNQPQISEPKLPIKKDRSKFHNWDSFGSKNAAGKKSGKPKTKEDAQIEKSVSLNSNKSLTDYFITKVNKIRRSRTLNENQIYELELQRKKLLESLFKAKQMPKADTLSKKCGDGSEDTSELHKQRSPRTPGYVINVEPKSPDTGLESNLQTHRDELFKRVFRTPGKNQASFESPRVVPQSRQLTLPYLNRRLQEPLEGEFRIEDDVSPPARPSTRVSVFRKFEGSCFLIPKIKFYARKNFLGEGKKLVCILVWPWPQILRELSLQLFRHLKQKIFF